MAVPDVTLRVTVVKSANLSFKLTVRGQTRSMETVGQSLGVSK